MACSMVVIPNKFGQLLRGYLAKNLLTIRNVREIPVVVHTLMVGVSPGMCCKLKRSSDYSHLQGRKSCVTSQQPARVADETLCRLS